MFPSLRHTLVCAQVLKAAPVLQEEQTARGEVQEQSTSRLPCQESTLDIGPAIHDIQVDCIRPAWHH